MIRVKFTSEEAALIVSTMETFAQTIRNTEVRDDPLSKKMHETMVVPLLERIEGISAKIKVASNGS